MVPAMLPASFWLQRVWLNSNENKQIAMIRNPRGIGLLPSPKFSVPNLKAELGKFTSFRSERKGSLLFP